MQPPSLWLNGRRLSGLANDAAPVLAEVKLVWGSDSAVDQPSPSQLTFSVLFKDSMNEVPDLTRGAAVELVHERGGEVFKTIFAGIIRGMRARPHEKLKGALVVECQATDYLAELDGEFVQTYWPEESGTERRDRLQNLLFSVGWYSEDLPDSPLISAATRLESIKVDTLLQRFISRYRGRRSDASFRNSEGEHRRGISVLPGNARRTPPDRLATTASGRWSRFIGTPIVNGQPSPLLEIPASNVLRDPEWTQSADTVVTGMQISQQTQADTGMSELVERNFKAPAGTIATYGLQVVSIESDVKNTADLQTVADAWMTDDAPWTLSALTIHDANDLDIVVAEDLLESTRRERTLVVLTDIMVNRPDPGPSALRSYLLGGEYTWNGNTWNFVLTLERTITALDGTADWWTAELIAASANTDVANATALSIGNDLTAADFKFIGAP